MSDNTEKALAIAHASPGQIERVRIDYSLMTPEGQRNIRRSLAPGVSDMDFDRFIAMSRARGLDPAAGEMWVIPGFGKDKSGEDKPAIVMPSITGYRKLADITGLVDGTEGPFFCGDDKQWTELWFSDTPPSGAKFIIHRKDQKFPKVAQVTWKARHKKFGNWLTHPAEMLGINAERDAWKRSGLIHSGKRATFEGAEGEDERATALRRVHAVASERGLSHEDIIRVVQEFDPEVENFDTVTSDDLHMAADLIESFGVNALPDDPEHPNPASQARTQFVFDIVMASGDDVDRTKKAEMWKELIARAPTISSGWSLLIENAPAQNYGDKIAKLALADGERQETVTKSLEVLKSRLEVVVEAQKKEDEPAAPGAATAAAPATPEPSPEDEVVEAVIVSAVNAEKSSPSEWGLFWAEMAEQGVTPAIWMERTGLLPENFTTTKEAEDAYRDVVEALETKESHESQADPSEELGTFREV